MVRAMSARRPRLMRQTELVERVRTYDPQADEELLNKAYVFAMQAHGPQKRASGDPYFSHPLEVAGILTDLKLDTATIATALLHDTVEDTSTTIAQVREAFGPEIEMLQAKTLVEQGIGETDYAIQRLDHRRQVRELRADVAGDPHDAQVRQRLRAPVRRLGPRDIDPELALLQARGDIGMRGRVHVRVDAQRHRRLFAQLRGHAVHYRR